jgi:polyhydroxyalkanoate synthesis regulator protein
MFTPFARTAKKDGTVATADKPGIPGTEDIDALKRQIEEMQRRIDKISDKD